MAQLQARRRPAALPVVISSSGLWAWASSVRRQFSQSAGAGFCSTASVTGVNSSTWARPGPPASSRMTVRGANGRQVMRISFG